MNPTLLQACVDGKSGWEYVLDLEFLEAVPCTYANAPMIGGLSVLGLLVFLAVSSSIYIRTGSAVIPFGLLLMTGGAVTQFIAPPGIAFATLVVLLVLGGVAAFAYHAYNR